MPTPADFWDEKFAGPDLKYGDRPNAFLVDQVWRLTPGDRVLVPGDGEGRNGVWLAGQGFAVETVDASPVAVQKATALALRKGVSLRTNVADLTAFEWPQERYKAVIAIFLHLTPEIRPTIHAGMIDALAPGGLILLQGFRPEQIPLTSGGPKNEAMLYTESLLRDDFGGLDILHLESGRATLDEGPGHQGPAELVSLVARKRDA